ncbi:MULTISPECIES: hypothetical protein [unclassified Bradyrhizobium]|uniref:hypothetical protein n=1 Tax=unclassified Bradyrhizobium TaxID=2631580 RepID=UPI0004075143|nr:MULTISPECIES: hypothetical protein [unclassified Bradyrhizobium]QIG97593.1 hypothetical protein G6P99_37955 [Bradyrhizobium sp. 6(2017)]
MRTPLQKFGTLAATLSAGVFLFAAQTFAQSASPPSTTATRPAKVLPDQSSVPSNGPPATTGQATGEASRDPMIKKMNEDEKQKVDTKGK